MSGQILGNQRSKEAHCPDCFCVKMIHSENLVVFDSVNHALQEGYNGCGHCLPEYNNCHWSLETAPKSEVINEQVIDEEKLIIGFSITEHREAWDVVIMGAGPIGLSALKEALNIKKETGHPLSVLVLEKSQKCGSDRRAETINANRDLDAVWEDGFLDSITIARHQTNVLYAPWAKQSAEVTMLEAPHSFHWRGDEQQKGLIDRMEEILGIEDNKPKTAPPKGIQKRQFHPIDDECFVFTEVEILEANIDEENPTLTPIKSIETSQGKVYAKTFLDCTGYTTRCGRQMQDYTTSAVLLDTMGFDEPYKTMVNPILKSNWRRNYPTDSFPSFQSFFIPRGAVESLTDSPPGIVVVFPDGKGNAEINLQVFNEYSTEKLSSWKEEVSRTETMWQNLKNSYPVLSDILSHFSEEDKAYETVTGMPCVCMLTPAMPSPALALVGDAAGHVNPKSSSGLQTGVQAARFWMRAAWEIAAGKKVWSASLKDQYNAAFMTTYLAHQEGIKKSFYQDLVNKHIEVNRNKGLMFGVLNWGSDENQDYWLHWLITILGYSAKEKKDALEISEKQYRQADLYQQSAIINAILSGIFVLNKAENTLLDFITITKETHLDEWPTFLSLLDRDKLFTKIQGKELDELFDLLGPLAAVEYTIFKESKWSCIQKVSHESIQQASFEQKVNLAKILVTSPPLGNAGEQKLLDILESVADPDKLKDLIRAAGGIDLFYQRVQGKERKRLQKLYPIYKSCLICSGDGKLYEAQKCQHCDGDGILKTETCPTCNGSGEVECWRCGGDGKIKDAITPKTCWNCNGTGKGWLFRKCVICGGDGQIFDNFPPDETCPKCLGTGKLECWQCGGKGLLDKKCFHCGGDGLIHDILDEQTCWHCQGKGKVLT